MRNARDQDSEMESAVLEVLRSTYDPEIPVNIVDLGLVYGVTLSDEGDVTVTMTLTTPACPVAEAMPDDIERRLLAISGVRKAHVEIVWDPPWTRERMSEAARLELGIG